MKKCDKVIFIEDGWDNIKYGDQFKVLGIDWLYNKKGKGKDIRRWIRIELEGTEYYIKAKHFVDLKKYRKLKLEKLNETSSLY